MTAAPEERALEGLRVVVTRPRGQAPEFTRLLEGAGAEVVEVPTIELVDPEDWGPVDRALEQLADYHMAIFTSVNGVERFWNRLQAGGVDPAPLSGMTIAAIGPATAAALRARGLAVEVVPAEFRAEGVLDEVARLLETPGSGAAPVRVLLPRALEARDVLPRGLEKLGAHVDVVPVYRAVPPPGGGELARRVLRDGADLLTFTSSSTVRNFVELLGDAGAVSSGGGSRPVVACIGPITAATAGELGLQVDILPEEYTVESLFAAMVAFFRDRDA